MRFKLSDIKNKPVRILFVIGLVLNALCLVLLQKVVNSDYFFLFLAVEIVMAIFVISTIFNQLIKKEENRKKSLE